MKFKKWFHLQRIFWWGGGRERGEEGGGKRENENIPPETERRLGEGLK